jgi:hypothetical protein
MAVALAAVAGSGAYIFYNTNILNEYRNSIDEEKFAADYEKTLLAF